MKIKAIIYGGFAAFFTLLAWTCDHDSSSRQSLGICMSLSCMLFLAEFAVAFRPKE